MFKHNPTLPAHGRLLFYVARGHRAPLGRVTALGLTPTACEERLVVPQGADDGVGVMLQAHPVAAVDLSDGLGLLLRPGIAASSGVGMAPGVGVYARAARLAVGMVADHHVAPVLHTVAGDDRSDDVIASWQVLLPVGGIAADGLRALADAMPASAHALPSPDADWPSEDGRHQGDGDVLVWHPYALLRAFVDAVADVLVRKASPHRPSGRPRARLLPWTARWQEAGVDPDDPTVPLRAERGEVLAGAREWLRPYEQPPTGHVPELLLEPPVAADQPWLLQFGLRGPGGERVPASVVWRESDAGPDRVEVLLEALARSARVCEQIEAALDDQQPTAAQMDSTAAWQFIDQTAPLLRDAGYRVGLPDSVAELRPRLQLGSPDHAPTAGVVDVSWQGLIGDQVVDDETVDALLASGEPLVQHEDTWVRVTPEAREGWARRDGVGPTVPLIEAIGLAVAGVGAGAVGARVVGATRVTAVGPLATIVDRLRGGSDADRMVTTPEGFHGELRGYQLDAVGWLEMMRSLGLGAVLADDMGLGKTVMLIAHLLTRPAGPHLVVCPTSVVTNWEREIKRFAPDLVVHRHHGTERAADLHGTSGVVVTSYGTLRRDIDVLAAVDWQVTALDEAQQVKNPDTLGARAVRRLRSAHCVALTGTPVENRLRELWSVIDLTNPGLLSTRAAFERRFAQPIERRGDQAARSQLRRLIAPFVLRRTKSDPRVAPDLPPRIERTVPCTMTDDQRRRYAAAVELFQQRSADTASGMQYRGAVLALLTRLKQICDHPALGGSGPGGVVGRSGKLAVAHQLVAEATQAGERVLVFTQFVGMARILVDEFSHALGTPIPMLHGGMSATARQRVVDQFQGLGAEPAPPVLVASLRAGGTGMNLTAATQVIHYDRWWNPAVEDQASDRAHRIGQTERVLIHALVTVGTLEERIDDLLTAKRNMASAIVGAGETWITELDPDALLELVQLGDSVGHADGMELVAADAGEGRR